MLVANTSIIVGEKIFRQGQTVTDLPTRDRNWMINFGYVSEIPDSAAEKKDRKERKQNLDAGKQNMEGQRENEFQGSVPG